jgi:hypothetical protein
MPCGLVHDAFNGDYDCSHGTTIDCGECKFGGGRKDPTAWANAPEEDQKYHRRELRMLRKKRELI